MSSIGRAYAALVLSAVIPIVGGAHSSLKMPKWAKKKLRELNGLDRRPEDEKDEEEIDRITASEAWVFPLIGSAVLLGLYLAFKYLDKDIINRIFKAYFALMGVGALARVSLKLSKSVWPESTWRRVSQWTLIETSIRGSSVVFSAPSLIATLVSTAVVLFQVFVNDHWLLANLVALSLAFNAIDLLRLDGFLTGTILLSGLFFYDIWWVFGTPVMESVARNLDAPIKVVWPKDAASKAFTLLGLGDIVLPGVFISLALRFDYSLALKRNVRPPKPSEHFKRSYFYACFCAYVAGLGITIAVMHVFRAAQPALLYLSPSCIGSVTGLAAWRGEWRDLWAYDDGENDENELGTGEKKLVEEDERDVGKSSAVEDREARSRKT